MTVEETREYMKALFLALRHVHSFHVIHRDIKPGNFLYNRKEKRLVCVVLVKSITCAECVYVNGVVCNLESAVSVYACLSASTW